MSVNNDSKSLSSFENQAERLSWELNALKGELSPEAHNIYHSKIQKLESLIRSTEDLMGLYLEPEKLQKTNQALENARSALQKKSPIFIDKDPSKELRSIVEGIQKLSSGLSSSKISKKDAESSIKELAGRIQLFVKTHPSMAQNQELARANENLNRLALQFVEGQTQQNLENIQFLYANTNQFATEDGKAACACLAGEIISGLLQNNITNASELDNYILAGITDYKEVISSINRDIISAVIGDLYDEPYQRGAKTQQYIQQLCDLLDKDLTRLTSSDNRLLEEIFRYQKSLLPPEEAVHLMKKQLFTNGQYLSWHHEAERAFQNRLQNVGPSTFKRLVSGEEYETYKSLLQDLERKAKADNKPIGALLLVSPEFYSLTVHPKDNGAVFFFADTHTSHLANKAFIGKADSLEAAARLLTERRSLPNEIAYEMEMIPVRLTESAQRNLPHTPMEPFSFQRTNSPSISPKKQSLPDLDKTSFSAAKSQPNPSSQEKKESISSLDAHILQTLEQLSVNTVTKTAEKTPKQQTGQKKEFSEILPQNPVFTSSSHPAYTANSSGFFNQEPKSPASFLDQLEISTLQNAKGIMDKVVQALQNGQTAGIKEELKNLNMLDRRIYQRLLELRNRFNYAHLQAAKELQAELENTLSDRALQVQKPLFQEIFPAQEIFSDQANPSLDILLQMRQTIWDARSGNGSVKQQKSLELKNLFSKLPFDLQQKMQGNIISLGRTISLNDRWLIVINENIQNLTK
ncbi:MAG: hypothetical protein Tsb0015_15810 [Simkaniaceae bacterium]